MNKKIVALVVTAAFAVSGAGAFLAANPESAMTSGNSKGFKSSAASSAKNKASAGPAYGPLYRPGR